MGQSHVPGQLLRHVTLTHFCVAEKPQASDFFIAGFNRCLLRGFTLDPLAEFFDDQRHVLW